MTLDELDSTLDNSLSIPILREFLDVEIQKRVTGTVRLEKTVKQHEETLSQELASETIAIERVSINAFIDEPAVSRQEGNVTIIPVMEEIVITRKQLVLKEEIRITRCRTTSQHREVVPLRSEDVQVVRLAQELAEGSAPSD